MTICEACGGTFFPESLNEVALYRALRQEMMEKPEAWHMTDALYQRLADFLPAAGAARGDFATTEKLFGIRRCESEKNRPVSSEGTA